MVYNKYWYLLFINYKQATLYFFFSLIFYNLLINIRDVNRRTNLGKIYFEKTYIITTRSINANVT